MMRNTQKYVIHNETFELDCRYSDVNLIGRGGYGAVISAFDCIRNEKVAIKKISHVFGDDRNIKAKRTLREIKLLHHFHAYNNIVSIHDLMTTPPNTNEIEDIYIVLQLFDSDLDQIISSPQPLSDSHNKYFMYQILRGLKNLVS
jgi:mitogen-activated protein kinase 1/3